MPKRMRFRVFLPALVLLVAACSGGGEPQAAAPAPQPAPASTTSTVATTTSTTVAPATTAPATTGTTTTTIAATASTLAPPADPAAGPDAEVARGLWLAYGAGDLEAVAAYTAPRYDAGCDADGVREAGRIAGTIALTATVVAVDDLGDWGTAVVRVEAEGEAHELTVPLVLVDGRWYADVDHCPLAVNAAELATQREIRSAILAAKGFFTDNGHYDATPAELGEWIATLQVAAPGSAPVAGEVAYVNESGRLVIFAHSPLGRSFCAALFAHDPVVFGSGGPGDVDSFDECAAIGASGGWVD